MSLFDKTLSRLVNEVSEKGFSDSQAMSIMMAQLRKAADSAFESDDQLMQKIRSALSKRFIQSINKNKKEVGRYGVEKIMPSLRTELDRRIMANASMIKLNREQAIDKTLQRFSGWASSVPVGGSKVIKKSEVINNIKKTAKQLKFETRRREIDQGHKLIAAINDIVAVNNGAIASMWHSHWRRPGYDYRVDHKERDKKIYVIRNGWAKKEGLINKGDGYTDEITQPGEEVYCSCYYEYVYSLSDLPSEMLTKKGKQELEQSRFKRAS